TVRLTGSWLDGPQPMILIALEDVTEQRLHEEQLARSDLALREADRRKDEFLGMLSHELRNPLAPIRNSLFILGKAKPGSEQAQNAHSVIARQIDHLSSIVEDLLDVTRIARGKVNLKRARFELAGLLARTVDDHLATFEASGLDLSRSFEPANFWVDAD